MHPFQVGERRFPLVAADGLVTDVKLLRKAWFHCRRAVEPDAAYAPVGEATRSRTEAGQRRSRTRSAKSVAARTRPAA